MLGFDWIYMLTRLNFPVSSLYVELSQLVVYCSLLWPETLKRDPKRQVSTSLKIWTVPLKCRGWTLKTCRWNWKQMQNLLHSSTLLVRILFVCYPCKSFLQALCLSEHVQASVLVLCYYGFIISALCHRRRDQRKTGRVCVPSRQNWRRERERAMQRSSAPQHKSTHILHGTCSSDWLQSQLGARQDLMTVLFNHKTWLLGLDYNWVMLF